MERMEEQRNPVAPLRLLSLDGGGVRGLSSLLILREVMEKIANEEKRLNKRPKNDSTALKPCDYFDLIGGTSTGGIIAILLGRLRQDVPTCIKIYAELSEEIFKHDRSIKIFGTKLPIGPNRFSGAVLEASIKKSLKKLGFKEDELLWDDNLFEEVEETGETIWTDTGEIPLTNSPLQRSPSGVSTAKLLDNGTASKSSKTGKHRNGHISHAATDPIGNPVARSSTWRLHRTDTVHMREHCRGCRAFVVSTMKNALGVPRIFSSYDANDHNTKIWEALRATSAAPTFFEEMTFGTPRMTYLDGGVGFNNPSEEVAYIASSLWPKRSIGLIVSVGTGLQSIPSVQKSIPLPFGLSHDVALASALVSMATSTARVDNEMQRTYSKSHTEYVRFDVDRGMAAISLEEYMKENEMGSLTAQYMNEPRQIRRSSRVAELMVRFGALPPKVEIGAANFRVGVDGKGLLHRDPKFPNIQCFLNEELDFKTGFPLGMKVSPEDITSVQELRSTSPSGRGGLEVDTLGRVRKIYPVAEDLDGDGKKQEAVVTTCVRADNICLRLLRTGIPQGKYNVHFILSVFDVQTGADDDTNSLSTRSFPPTPIQFPTGMFDDDGVAEFTVTDEGAANGNGNSSEEKPIVSPPTDLIFSAGRPFDPSNFTQRYLDVRITPDVVTALMHPNAVRVRLGRRRYRQKKGKGWFEVAGDIPVEVGLDGSLGIVINKKFETDEFVGGWSFGGVRLTPVFEEG
ncbi:MAG: hypothetical protein M1819_001052 [Sarea resinae]|nr:MAG: hypothetical protein M1819_001052 [Sarea resinae]